GPVVVAGGPHRQGRVVVAVPVVARLDLAGRVLPAGGELLEVLQPALHLLARVNPRPEHPNDGRRRPGERRGALPLPVPEPAVAHLTRLDVGRPVLDNFGTDVKAGVLGGP